MRAIFFGTPEIAVPSLEALASIADVVMVISQPDRPKGRGLELMPPAVKVRALELGLPVHQPTKVRTPELAMELGALRADVALVLAYGRILPAGLLRAPRLGCLNLHASLLPRYRGAAPIQWAIMRGEPTTGVSLMQMDEGLDTGAVYSERTTPIGPDESAGELAARLGPLAATMVVEDLPKVVRSELVAKPQVEQDATLAPLLKKEDGLVDWARPAKSVHDHVRGMSPWPGAFTFVGSKMLKVLSTRPSRFGSAGADPGTVIAADTSGVLVACLDGTIELLRGQLEGRKALSARELVAGRALETEHGWARAPSRKGGSAP